MIDLALDLFALAAFAIAAGAMIPTGETRPDPAEVIAPAPRFDRAPRETEIAAMYFAHFRDGSGRKVCREIMAPDPRAARRIARVIAPGPDSYLVGIRDGQKFVA